MSTHYERATAVMDEAREQYPWDESAPIGVAAMRSAHLRDKLGEAFREIDKLNADLAEVAGQRDRLKAQVLGDCDLAEWRRRINEVLAPLVEYEDGVLVDDTWEVELDLEDSDRPPVRLKGELDTDHACERWEAELRQVDWEMVVGKPLLVYRVRSVG